MASDASGSTGKGPKSMLDPAAAARKRKPQNPNTAQDAEGSAKDVEHEGPAQTRHRRGLSTVEDDDSNARAGEEWGWEAREMRWAASKARDRHAEGLALLIKGKAEAAISINFDLDRAKSRIQDDLADAF